MSDVRFLIDLTTSKAYRGRNAVGIVRTEREIGKAFLSSGFPVEFFHFDRENGEFTAIPKLEVEAILGENIRITCQSTKNPFDYATSAIASQSGSDSLIPFLNFVTDKLYSTLKAIKETSDVQIAADYKIEFFSGDCIISAGLLWDGNFLEKIFRVKKSVDLKLFQIIYDIVPVIIPEFCVPGMNIRFPKFLLDAAWTADAFYCISNSTLNDVSLYCAKHKLPTPKLLRFHLGADVLEQQSNSSVLSNLLRAGKFILYVSTIEPRKNHLLLFHVWRRLFQEDLSCLVPLVIVGQHGWNSSDLITMMQAAEHLYPEYIKIMTEVSDDDLDWLYRNCSFTVYPSLYEGWGLPVAESLAHGKLCIASNTSSIPEVAGGFGELIDPLDLILWTSRIHHYLKAPEEVRAHESNIRKYYTSISWPSAMSNFVESVSELVDLTPVSKGDSHTLAGR